MAEVAKKGIADLLATKNHHPRDDRIIFDEDAHTYTVDGDIYPTSVSGIVHSLFPQFDAEEVIAKNFDKWKDNKQSPYYRYIQYAELRMHLNEDEIKKELAKTWNAFGNSRAEYGTAIHLSAELFLNEAPRNDPSPEYHQFVEWYKKEKPASWVPYRTEWSVFHEPSKTAGQIDGLFQDTADGSFHMVDWKCVAKLESRHAFGERGFPPFEALHNANLNHYLIQQNLYRWILKQSYGIECKTLRLLQVHYTIEKATEFELPIFDKEIDKVMQLRCTVSASAAKRHKTIVGTQDDIDINVKKIDYYKKLIASLESENDRIRKTL